MRAGVTPVPIPNTMVKPRTADGTMLATVWKSRRVPENFFKKTTLGGLPVMYVQEGNFPGVDGRQRPGRKAEETHLENFIPRKKTSNIRESIEACRSGMRRCE